MSHIKNLFQINDESLLLNEIHSIQDVNIKGDHGNSLLTFCAKKGFTAACEELLNKGADPNEINETCDTALHWAVRNQFETLVQLLLRSGSNPISANNSGNTPLHYACFYRLEAIARLLLDHGAHLEITNVYGQSPLEFSGPMASRLRAYHTGKANQQNKDQSPSKNKVRRLQLVIPSHSIVMGNLIRKTPNYDVYQGQYHKQDVLVKKLFTLTKTDAEAKARVLKSAIQMHQGAGAVHPHLCSLLGGQFDSQYLSVVYETPSITTLEVFIHDSQAPPDKSLALSFAKQISSALQFLHDQNLFHLNLKSNCIYMADDKSVRVSDYGLMGTCFSDLVSGSLTVFEPQWLPPEVLTEGEVSRYASLDVYSFGMVLYELFTGRYPFDGTNAMLIGLQVAVQGRSPMIPEHLNKDLRAIIKQCCNYDLEQRPSFQYLTHALEIIPV